MHRFALVAAVAAVVAVPALFTSTGSAEARTRVTVSPYYVPAVYCSYKSKDWVQRGIVSCPGPFAPIGDVGTKWKTSGGTVCWKVGSGGVSTYHGYWGSC